MNTIQSGCLIAILLTVFGMHTAAAQNINANITELKSAKGRIVIQIYKDNETFKDEKPFKKMQFSKQGYSKGNLQIDFALDPGVYGITLLDDENENGEMDKNMIRMPKEGFGFANYYLEKLKRPLFDEFKVTIKPGSNKVNIRVKYL
jgi:uncharacterized protein (DUF2141 family)